MTEFARYFISFIGDFFTNVGIFFRDLFYTFANIFIRDIPNYFKAIGVVAPSFGVLDWIMFVITALVSIAFWFFVIYRIVQLIRRYFVFRSREVEKDQLLEELAKCKAQIARLTIEKNQIYAMKLSGGREIVAPAEVVSSQSQDDDFAGTDALAGKSRFLKLSMIDKNYENVPAFISTDEQNGVTLDQIVDTFVNFSASQLKFYYKKDVIRAYLAGMSVTKVIILEGISGTGKTSLPYAMGKFFAHDTSIVSVQPSWHDKGDLLGYLNEFTKIFNETDFVCSLYEATYREDPSFIVLDEMNLARIEYYFAEFLSMMEMPDISEWKINVVASPDKTDPKHFKDGKILVPQSLWFVGTANQDDSTFAISDKVYDRTITIDMNERAEAFNAPATQSMKISYDYLFSLFQEARKDFSISEKSKECLNKIDKYLFNNFKITFGNRILKQFYSFVPVYIACGGTETEALDFLLMSKIFRKLNAVNLVFAKKELKGLITLLESLFGKNKVPNCVAFIEDLMAKA